MYAVIQDGGHQFRVAEGDVVDVDFRDTEEDGGNIAFDRVLLVRDDDDIKVGTPLVKGAKVIGEIVAPAVKGPKVKSYYLRRRKASKKKVGHRQKYTRVKITRIKS